MNPSFRARTRTLLAASIAVLQAFSAVAGTIQFTRGGLNARDSKDFRRGAGNLLGTVPAGTEGDVVGRFKLPSGNYAIQLEISKIDTTKTRLKPKQKIWVYYHNDADLRRVALYDDAGKKHDNAVDGDWAVAIGSFKVAVEKPKTESESENDGGKVCTNCHVDDGRKYTLPLENGEVAVAEKIVDEVKEENSDAPVMDVSVEEIASFLRNLQKANLSNRDFKDTSVEENRKIARIILDEANRQGVDPTLVLGMIAQESKGYAREKSGAGARGIMQIMPATYRDATKDKTHKKGKTDYAKLYDPAINIRIGIGEIADNIKRYSSLKIALQVYNWGSGNYANFLVDKCKKKLRGADGRCRMPAETENYYALVTGWQKNYRDYQASGGQLFVNLDTKSAIKNA